MPIFDEYCSFSFCLVSIHVWSSTNSDIFKKISLKLWIVKSLWKFSVSLFIYIGAKANGPNDLKPNFVGQYDVTLSFKLYHNIKDYIIRIMKSPTQVDLRSKFSMLIFVILTIFYNIELFMPQIFPTAALKISWLLSNNNILFNIKIVKWWSFNYTQQKFLW